MALCEHTCTLLVLGFQQKPVAHLADCFHGVNVATAKTTQ